MGERATPGWSRWWWDVTVWGIILVTALVHALLYKWTDEHTLAVGLMGSWVAFSLFQIRRDRSRRQRETSSAECAVDTDQKPSSTTGVNRLTGSKSGRLVALVLLAVMVVVILSTGNLIAPAGAPGVWIGMEFVLRQDRKDPIERRPHDPSLHDSTRRN